MFNSNIINGAKSDIINWRMRLSKQRYIYKTKYYTDVCTDFIIWKKATKNTISNQVPKPYMFSITQCMLEEKIIVYLWVTGLWFFLLSFYFLVFSFCLQWAYIFLPMCYVLEEEAEESIKSLSSLPACWYSSRCMVAAEGRGCQKSDNKQMVFSYTTCHEVNGST